MTGHYRFYEEKLDWDLAILVPEELGVEHVIKQVEVLPGACVLLGHRRRSGHRAFVDGGGRSERWPQKFGFNKIGIGDQEVDP